MSFTGGKDSAFTKKLRDAYMFIPSNTVVVDGEKKDVEGFYMMAREVTNIAYREFLSFLEVNGKTAALEIAKVRSEGWMLPNAEMEPIARNYFPHPAYEEYPVVNITYEAALLYCDFLKEALNQSSGMKEGYEVVECRLPTRAEWMMAARGNHELTPYPWGGHYVRNAKGCLLANFNPIGTESITFDSKTNEYRVVESANGPSLARPALFTAPVDAFHPNDFGLYNMSGNVAEMVQEEGLAVGGSWRSTGFDIRVDSKMTFDGFSPEIGFRPLLVIAKK